MKTVVLVETIWKGHHPTFYKYFCRALAELGHRVWALCPEPEELQRWLEERCPEARNAVTAFKFGEPSSFFARVLHHLPLSEQRLVPLRALLRWGNAAHSIKNISISTGQSPDVIFFSFIDHYYVVPQLPAFLIDTMFPYNWSGLYFHPRHLRTDVASRLNPDKLFLLGKCKAAAVLDEGISDKLSMRINAKPVIAFPDITDDENGEEQPPVVLGIKEKAGGRKIIGLMGNLGKKKNFLNLLRVAQMTRDRNWFYLFAGPIEKSSFTPEELELIRVSADSAHDNIFFYFGSLKEGAEYNAFVNASDILFAAYQDWPHSSNTLTKAAIFEKPLVVSTGYCSAERVEKYRLGEIIDDKDPASYIAALERLLSPSSSLDGRRFRDYCDAHSLNGLKSAFKELLSFY